ncbi:MAG TPA: redoxin domain-containing protein [Planctomycetota bacterium]|nr:redoxin domain-containing protein [Planctomycetota bacterium]
MKTHLVKWDETYRKQGLVIIDIDNGNNDTMEELKDAVEKGKVKYPVAWDENEKTCEEYGIRAYAASFLIGTDGKVVWEGFPLGKKIEEREAQVKEQLKKVTDETKKKIEEEMKEPK